MNNEPITLDWIRRSTAAALTRTQVAEALDVDPRTVTEAIKSGTIPAIRLGRRVLIPREPFLAMLTATDALAVPA